MKLEKETKLLIISVVLAIGLLGAAIGIAIWGSKKDRIDQEMATSQSFEILSHVEVHGWHGLVLHDTTRGATCWTVERAISCLPDSALKHP